VKSPAQTVRVQTVRRALLARLKDEEVNFRWVVCVRNGRRYRHLPVVRCNVNFAVEPHVEVYCAVLDRGHLVTNHDNSAIPCGHDNAGASVPVEGS
jgi:hypothetical protein